MQTSNGTSTILCNCNLCIKSVNIKDVRNWLRLYLYPSKNGGNQIKYTVGIRGSKLYQLSNV